MSDSFPRRVLVAAGLAALVAALLLALWAVRHVVLLGFGGLLLAVLLSAAADWVSEHTPLPRGGGLAAVLLALAGLLAVTVWFVIPMVQGQVQQLVDALPRAVDRVQQRIGDAAWVSEALSGVRSLLAGIVPTILSGTVGGLTGLAVVLAVGIYLAADPERYRDGLIRLVPRDGRARAAEVVDAVGHALRWFLVGQLAAMVGVGVVFGVGLALVGVPHALTLGIIAGLLEFIPYLGPILALVPAALIALGESPTLGLWAAAVWLVVQQLEGHVFTPMAQAKAVSLPPAVTILGLIAFGTLFGFLGLLLGTPLAAVILVVTRMLYLRDTLRDPAEVRREAGTARSGAR